VNVKKKQENQRIASGIRRRHLTGRIIGENTKKEKSVRNNSPRRGKRSRTNTLVVTRIGEKKKCSLWSRYAVGQNIAKGGEERTAGRPSS